MSGRNPEYPGLTASGRMPKVITVSLIALLGQEIFETEVKI
jgi:hypothetical protein